MVSFPVDTMQDITDGTRVVTVHRTGQSEYMVRYDFDGPKGANAVFKSLNAAQKAAHAALTHASLAVVAPNQFRDPASAKENFRVMAEATTGKARKFWERKFQMVTIPA